VCNESVRLVVDREDRLESEQIRTELMLTLRHPLFETMGIEVPLNTDESRRPTTRCWRQWHGVLRGMGTFEPPGGRVRIEGPDSHQASEPEVGQGGDIAHHAIGDGEALRRVCIIRRPPVTAYGSGGFIDNYDAVEVNCVARHPVSQKCCNDRRHIGITGGRNDHAIRTLATPAEVLDDRHEVKAKGAAGTVIVSGECNSFLGMDLDPGTEVAGVGARVNDCCPLKASPMDQAAGERRGVGAEAAGDNRDWK